MPAESVLSGHVDVHDNLRVDALDAVNLRLWGDGHGPAEGPIGAPLAVLADLQRRGPIRHLASAT